MSSKENPIRIVMVDDDLDDIFLTKMAFKKFPKSYEFLGLTSGDDFFNYITTNGIGSIDIVLLDLNMPVRDGHDVLAELRTYPGFANLFVIVFTTSNRNFDLDVSEVLGADGYFVKPSTTAEVKELLDLIDGIVVKSRSQTKAA